jgi:Transglutaminase-like superfamily
MSQHLVATADDVIEQIIVQCWLYRARAGDVSGARARAERTLERLLARGLPHAMRPDGTVLLDPYAASNAIRCRVGEDADEAWEDWLRTGRESALCLPPEVHRYRLTLRREWHSFKVQTGRPLIFRLPLPQRQTPGLPAQVRLMTPAGAILDRRDSDQHIELRLDPGIAPPVVAEMTVEFSAGEARDAGGPAAVLDAPFAQDAQLWLREREGLIRPSAAVTDLARQLGHGKRNTREFVHAVWEWLTVHLYCGDVHRSDLSTMDPLGGLLSGSRVDCILASFLMTALCRSRGIPARVLSGFILQPGAVAPHSWVEVALAPGHWAPFDFGSWCFCAGDVRDPAWGNFFRGRVDARMIAEVAPHVFTGWGSATLPERWFRHERLRGQRMEHTLRALDTGALLRRDTLQVEIAGSLGPQTG